MKPLSFPRYLPGSRPRNAGVALVIVLAFVVIITGVILAFFSQSLFTRQISDASANQAKADLLAQGASASIIADLQQEIAMGSTVITGTVGTTATNVGYAPSDPVYMLPQMSGTTSANGGTVTWAPNFLIRSANGQPFFIGSTSNIPASGTTGAIAVSSTTPSLNGRYVSLARWNSHYMLPLTGTGADSTPSTLPASYFQAPDWVLLTRGGSSPSTWSSTFTNPSVTNNNYVIGRYAYAVYHEGGLLDANVAGYPVGSGGQSVTGTAQSAGKPSLAYADLTQIGLTQSQIDQLVAWRNPVSADVSGTSFQTPTYSTASGASYYTYATNNPSGFLRVSGTMLNNNGTLSTSNGQSDRMFGSRQELIGFMKNGLGLNGLGLNSLNYLATFTRGINQPSVGVGVPAYGSSGRPSIQATSGLGWNNELGLDNLINPSFLTVRVSGTFTRNDGSIAVKGDPYVKQRFALSKLVWLTYLGPSAYRVIPPATPAPSPSSVNYDMWQLVYKYGVSPTYLALGTKANIQQYFGLNWQVDTIPASSLRSPTAQAFHDGEYKWFYNIHLSTFSSSSTTPASISGSQGTISRLGSIAGFGTPRDPDFFELLKATVQAGSKARASMNSNTVNSIYGNTYQPYYYEAVRDNTLDYAIIQLGANIIDQAKVDGYSTRIVIDNGSPTAGSHPQEFRGVENLPYVYRFQTASLKVRMENPQATKNPVALPGGGPLKDTGVGLLMGIPTIWNPHDNNAPLGAPGPTGPGVNATFVSGTSNNFRLVADSVYPDYLSPTAASYSTYVLSGEFSSSTASTNNSDSAPTVPYTTGANGAGAKIVPYLTSNNGSPNAVAGPGNPLYPVNSALSFRIPTSVMFREPTPLAMAGFPYSNSNLMMAAPVSEYTQIMNSASKPCWTGTGFLSDVANPLDLPGAGAPTNRSYLGFCLGLYPVEWEGPAVGTGTGGIYPTINIVFNPLSGGYAYLDMRAQYKDPNIDATAFTSNSPYGVDGSAGSNLWETYDEKYTLFNTLFLATSLGTASGNLSDQADGAQGGDWQSYADPRTARFSGIGGENLENPVQTPGGSGEAQEWSDGSGVSVTDRPDANSGYAVTDDRNKFTPAIYELYPLLAGGWNLGQGTLPYFRIGMLSQNTVSAQDNGIRFANDTVKSPGDNGPICYPDADGVVRGAMGNYWTGGNSLVGSPLATAYPNTTSNNPVTTNAYQGQSRPYFLHRPFRSVAELGYVFSGTPWKNIDFFTPVSGDAALLDVFSANEVPTQTSNSNPLVAGVVNLNTKQAPVIQALLSGASTDEAQTSGTASSGFFPFGQLAGGGQFSASQWATILSTGGTGTVLQNIATSPANETPLVNVSDLVSRWVSSNGGAYNGLVGDLSKLYSGAYGGTQASTMTNVDRFRETFIRPLTAVGNTRVWNLLIDVVAQTGRYPQGNNGSNAAANFVVEGEQRYWVHVAIDRFTGQVLDKHVEVVKD
jgi:hypothetical protein